MVADVGNTRIKWCACRAGLLGSMVSLPEDENEWAKAAPLGALTWVLASVRPERSERLRRWLEQRGDRVRLLTVTDLPLSMDVEFPARTGIDRLLNAVAAVSRLDSGEAAVVVDAGSAVTVDLVDGCHVFRGGTIFPGIDLMAEALHRYTAFLPRVTVTLPLPPVPARSTIPAIQQGIYRAVVGGIKEIVAVYGVRRVFLTGGQAAVLAPALSDYEWWPEMTLMGIHRSAEGLP